MQNLRVKLQDIPLNGAYTTEQVIKILNNENVKHLIARHSLAGETSSGNKLERLDGKIMITSLASQVDLIYNLESFINAFEDNEWDIREVVEYTPEETFTLKVESVVCCPDMPPVEQVDLIQLAYDHYSRDKRTERENEPRRVCKQVEVSKSDCHKTRPDGIILHFTHGEKAVEEPLEEIMPKGDPGLRWARPPEGKAFRRAPQRKEPPADAATPKESPKYELRSKEHMECDELGIHVYRPRERVSAIQWTGKNGDDVAYFGEGRIVLGTRWDCRQPVAILTEKFGSGSIPLNGYAIKYSAGNFGFLTKEQFEAKFEVE